MYLFNHLFIFFKLIIKSLLILCLNARVILIIQEVILPTRAAKPLKEFHKSGL